MRDSVIAHRVEATWWLVATDRLPPAQLWLLHTSSMRLRTKLVEIGMPDNLIDTDGNFRFSMRPDYIKLIHEQNECGIPCIYNAEKVFRSRTFNLPISSTLSEEQYEEIAKAFAEYNSRKTAK